jgi:hypothetical protein
MSIDDRVKQQLQRIANLVEATDYNLAANALAMRKRGLNQHNAREHWVGHFSFVHEDELVTLLAQVPGIDQTDVDPGEHIMAIINACERLAEELLIVLQLEGYDIETEDDGDDYELE